MALNWYAWLERERARCCMPVISPHRPERGGSQTEVLLGLHCEALLQKTAKPLSAQVAMASTVSVAYICKMARNWTHSSFVSLSFLLSGEITGSESGLGNTQPKRMITWALFVLTKKQAIKFNPWIFPEVQKKTSQYNHQVDMCVWPFDKVCECPSLLVEKNPRLG